ncbi:hypothetical protein HT031_006409 [Scenedesmus sp. PABB004]|nr:hypothetical protein HT031_006409 [Scenedesmus sp. PABB004]
MLATTTLPSRRTPLSAQLAASLQQRLPLVGPQYGAPPARRPWPLLRGALLLALAALAGFAAGVASRGGVGEALAAAAEPALPASAASAAGWCTRTHAVTTWSGAAVPVCNWSTCAGREGLRELSGASAQPRWAANGARERYMQLAFNATDADAIDGWLDEPHVRYVDAFTEMQHDAGVFGSVVEIGVHAGKFFIALAGAASEDEPALAVDLFESQSDNVDGSGRGSRAAVLRNLDAVGLPRGGVTLLAANSLSLTAANLSALGLPAARLVSVDGGHSLENTLHDLMLASCVLADGGIAVLDDFTNPTWTGVAEAAAHFASAQSRLRLLFVAHNKAYFTTASHKARYVRAMQARQGVFGCRDLHSSRRALGGSEACYGGPAGEPGQLQATLQTAMERSYHHHTSSLEARLFEELAEPDDDEVPMHLRSGACSSSAAARAPGRRAAPGAAPRPGAAAALRPGAPRRARAPSPRRAAAPGDAPAPRAAPASSAAMAAAPASPPVQIGANKMFGGVNRRYRHASAALGCDMTFTVFFPPGADPGGEPGAPPPPPAGAGAPVPVLYYLSGLTCTDENVIQKAGAQRGCAAAGLAFVAPDTSPRGLGVEGEAEAWDFGVGAGFYVNATQPKWAAWRMYDYVTKELPALLASSFPGLDTATASIMGHSMGGHGALTVALKNPGVYRSVSAFAPICNPCAVPWGVKAFTGYFGADAKELWAAHDASELVARYAGPALPCLIDTGTTDSFLEVQLKPEVFEAAAAAAGFPVTMRMQEGYDHSYFFMATFMDEHVAFHSKALKP